MRKNLILYIIALFPMFLPAQPVGRTTIDNWWRNREVPPSTPRQATWASFWNKVDDGTPALASRNLTINGVTRNLATDASWTISSDSILASTNEITRPANTTAYSALDAISSSSTAPTCITFTNMTRNPAESGYITAALIQTDQSTCTARFRLYLFTATVTAINDNAPYTLLYSTRSTAIGSITFDAVTTEGSGSTAASSLNSTVRIPFRLPSGTAIYGLLETLDAFTPNSGQKFYVQLYTDSN